jgi:S1-C subfamily serine protease
MPFSYEFYYDENYIITGFHLDTDADSAGIMIGDKIIGVNGLDVKDERLSQHVMGIRPGDQISYTMIRDGKRMNFKATALPNY